MTFDRSTSSNSSKQAKRCRLSFSAVTVLGSSLFFMLPLSAEAAGGSEACKFGTPNLAAYKALLACDTISSYTLGDKRLTLNGTDSTLYQLPTVGNGAILFSWDEIGAGDGYLQDVWSVTVDFDPNLVAPPTANGKFKYTLDVVDPNWIFDTVDMDSKTSQNGGTVKIQKLLPEGYIDEATPLISLNGSNVVPVPFFGDFTSIAVTDTYDLTVTGGQSIILQDFANNFTQKSNPFIPPESEAPGPLPLLGAGAAFGFSRRLRSRLLAARRG